MVEHNSEKFKFLIPLVKEVPTLEEVAKRKKRNIKSDFKDREEYKCKLLISVEDDKEEDTGTRR